MEQKPAVSLAAVPGKRRAMIDLARDIERSGYPGIYCPSIGDGLALSEAIALVTEHIEIATAISPIYFRQAAEYAQTIAFIHEISGGRFRFGIGVSHRPALAPRGLDGGKPLADTRTFVAQLRATPRVGDATQGNDNLAPLPTANVPAPTKPSPTSGPGRATWPR